jgi:hypothetical protein
MSVKNNYSKINFLYRNPTGLGSAYMYFRGLRTALERNSLLNYAYDVGGAQPLNMNELLKCPILCITGSWEPVFSVVKLISGKQFVAEINPESLFPEHFSRSAKLTQKKNYVKILKLFYQKQFSEILELLQNNIFKPIDCFKTIKNRNTYFDLYFTPVEEDVDSYLSFGKPCYWFPTWAHTELLDDIEPPTSEKIGFIGRISGPRVNFFNQDKNKIIECSRTILKNDSLENTKELCRLINKYKYLVCPMGATVRTIPGKVFEYMACKRLCFCYLNEEYIFKHKLLFEDEKEIVYFKTFTELEEKYRYYLENPEKANQIAQAGYEKVRKYHNADIRAKRFAELVLHHANGGEYNESYNDVSLFGGKT